MKKLSIIFFVLFIAFFSFQCTKEGPVGPAGEDGNANVQVFIKSVSVNQWVEYGTFGAYNHNYGTDINISELTSDISTNGTVLAYIKSDDVYLALPFTAFQTNYFNVFNYTHTTGIVEVFKMASDYMTLPPTTIMNFKIVLIDGLVNIPNSLDIKDYNKVSEYFDLEY